MAEALGRRALIVGGGVMGLMETANAQESPIVTSKVYLDIGRCPAEARNLRQGGETGALCGSKYQDIGRMVLDIYGDVAPSTAEGFLSLVESKALQGVAFTRVVPGEFVAFGRRGRARRGDIETLPEAFRSDNDDLTQPGAFATVAHDKPGVVSLAVGHASQKDNRTEILITTGPGPTPDLDGQDIGFGAVEEGYDVLAEISRAQTYAPSRILKAYNAIGETFGDSRAKTARLSWERPQDTWVIADCGRL